MCFFSDVVLISFHSTMINATTVAPSKFSGGYDLMIQPCLVKNKTSEESMACTTARVIGFTAAYIFPIYGLFGSVTNVVNFIVFAIWWPKKTRQTIYLASIAVVDFLMVFIYGWIGLFGAKGLPWASFGRVYFKTFNLSSLTCSLHNYVIAVVSCLATSLFLLAVADRTFSVFFPMKAQSLGKGVAYVSVGCVVVCCFVSQIPIGVYVRWYTEKGETFCWITGSANDDALNIFHLIFADVGIFQTVCIILLNVGLIYKVRAALMARRKLQEGCGTKKKDKELSASILILILSGIFVICCLPQAFGYGLATAIQYSSVDNQLMMNFGWNLGDFGWFLFFFQESINWIVYMVRMPKFRSIVMEKCFCRKQNKKMPRVSYTV